MSLCFHLVLSLSLNAVLMSLSPVPDTPIDVFEGGCCFKGKSVGRMGLNCWTHKVLIVHIENHRIKLPRG